MSFRNDLDALKTALQNVLADRVSLSSLNLTDANDLLNRANMIGEQPIQSILGLESSLNSIINQIENISLTGGGGAVIDDATTDSSKVWSSEKLNTIIGDIDSALNIINLEYDVSIADRLAEITTIRNNIAAAIEATGITVGTAPLADMASKIGQITAQNTTYLNNITNNLITAIEEKGISATGVSIENLPAKILEISSGPVVPADGFNGTLNDTPDFWVRPAEWLPKTTFNPEDDGISILVHVKDQTSARAELILNLADTINGTTPYNTVIGTIDWGDGVVENIVGSDYEYVGLNHDYNYNNLTNTLLSNSNTKQACIKIVKYPQHQINGEFQISAGSDSVELKEIIFHSNFIYNVPYNNSFTSIEYLKVNALQEVIKLTGNKSVEFYNIVGINNENQFDFSYFFYNNYKIKEVRGFRLKENSDLSYCFYSAKNLEYIEFINQENAAFYSANAFYQCSKLKAFSNLNFRLKNCNSAFYNCCSIKEIGNIFLAEGTNNSYNDLFAKCISLKKIGNITIFSDNINEAPAIGSGCSTTGMFFSCNNLETLGTLNLTGANSVSSLFYNCTALKEAKNINAPIATDCSYMFNDCTSLSTAKNFNLPNVTSIDSLFYNTYRLSKVSNLNFDKVTSISNLFNDSPILEEIDGVSLPLVSSMYNGIIPHYYTTPTIKKIVATFGESTANISLDLTYRNELDILLLNNFVGTVNLTYSNLSKTTAEAFFNSLGTVTDKSINISNTPAAKDSTLNTSIATAKGWTVIS